MKEEAIRFHFANASFLKVTRFFTFHLTVKWNKART
jgi:hypothetical protein